MIELWVEMRSGHMRGWFLADEVSKRTAYVDADFFYLTGRVGVNHPDYRNTIQMSPLNWYGC